MWASIAAQAEVIWAVFTWTLTISICAGILTVPISFLICLAQRGIDYTTHGDWGKHNWWFGMCGDCGHVSLRWLGARMVRSTTNKPHGAYWFCAACNEAHSYREAVR